jgi:ABC-type transport system substrate-binding protein
VEAGASIRYTTFNVQDKTLSNKYLRQALSAAIDREKWIEIFTNNTAKKMTNAVPIGVAGRPENSRIKYDFDVKRAKELLKKAGYPNGEGLPTINFDLRGADSLSRQIGEFFTKQWNAVGVKVNVIPNTFPAFLEKMRQGALQASYGGWVLDYPDAENIFQLLYGPNKTPGPNDANYDVPAMNKLYEQMAFIEAGPKRSALIQQMDDLAQEDAPWVYGYYERRHRLVQPWLRNYREDEIILNKYKYLRLDPTKRDKK